MLVDTNVLVDVLENDPEWVDWSISQLRSQARVYQLTVNPVIYSELASTFSSVKALDAAIVGFGLRFVEIPKDALFLAGKAFVKYRQMGGTKSNVLSDFFIGAHAAVSDLPILTRDTRRYVSYFPTVRLVCP